MFLVQLVVLLLVHYHFLLSIKNMSTKLFILNAHIPISLFVLVVIGRYLYLIVNCSTLTKKLVNKHYNSIVTELWQLHHQILHRCSSTRNGVNNGFKFVRKRPRLLYSPIVDCQHFLFFFND